MDAINIILEFESENKEEIEKDIYSPEREFVDFNILIPCPQELEEQVSGSPENASIDLVKKYKPKFDLNSVNLRQDIKDFIEKYKEEEYFLIREQFKEEDLESVVNSIIAYEKYGYANWMRFKKDKWGVGYNAFYYGKKRRTKSGGFYFVCSGRIPVEWLLALSKKWPDVLFKIFSRMEYSERQGFVNEYHFKNNDYIRMPDVKRSF